MAPSPYQVNEHARQSQSLELPWSDQDPRSSSTQSLVPQTSTSDRRTLLLVYVHGFMGNETSFQHFPAHVHNVLTETLKESHVVHTKVYPKYKTRCKVGQVKQIFSEWLAPHESPDKDIILLGHSMGGILDAEVVLLPWYTTGSQQVYKHRILGTVNFDTPFLGMHPGIVGSGISSLFRRNPESPQSSSPAARPSSELQTPRPSQEHIQSSVIPVSIANKAAPDAVLPSGSDTGAPLSSTSSLSIPANDPNYDPPFWNDVHIPKRSGWSNAMHFLDKHAGGLKHATETYVTSHFEFGGAMADFKALRSRYARIKALEKGEHGRRVRFVNYYTVSIGRPKRPKDVQTQKSCDKNCAEGLKSQIEGMTVQDVENDSTSKSPRISTETARMTIEDSSTVLSEIPTAPLDNPTASDDELLGEPSTKENHEQRLDTSSTTTKESDSGRYNHKKAMMEQARTAVEDKTMQVGVPDANPDNNASVQAIGSERLDEEQASKKPPRERRFCVLPSKVNGEPDPCWVKVFMPDVDEVGAHCGLFEPGDNPERYETFVWDVSLRIVDWLAEENVR